MGGVLGASSLCLCAHDNILFPGCIFAQLGFQRESHDIDIQSTGPRNALGNNPCLLESHHIDIQSTPQKYLLVESHHIDIQSTPQKYLLVESHDIDIQSTPQKYLLVESHYIDIQSTPHQSTVHSGAFM